MKHVVLFENFLTEAASGSGDFQFFPFDVQKEPQSKYGLPDTASVDDLLALSESNIPDSAWEIGKGTGLYIAHNKDANQGFTRAVVKSLSPLTFDFSVYNSDFEKIAEKKGVSKQTLGQIQKEADGFKFLSDLRKSFPEIFEYLKSSAGRSDLAADMGELFY